MEYTFTLKYALPPVESDMDALVERLGAQGCTDATVGLGQPGRLALEFTRSASSAHAALQSALNDVAQAIPLAVLVEAGPDFVGLSDVAARVGVTRQNLHKLTQAHAATFPAPVHDGSAPTWHLVDVLNWLAENQAYRLDQTWIELATATKQANLLNQITRHQFTQSIAQPLATAQRYDSRRKRVVLTLASGAELAFKPLQTV